MDKVMQIVSVTPDGIAVKRYENGKYIEDETVFKAYFVIRRRLCDGTMALPKVGEFFTVILCEFCKIDMFCAGDIPHMCKNCEGSEKQGYKWDGKYWVNGDPGLGFGGNSKPLPASLRKAAQPRSASRILHSQPRGKNKLFKTTPAPTATPVVHSSHAQCGGVHCDECKMTPEDCDEYRDFLASDGARLAPQAYKCNGKF